MIARQHRSVLAGGVDAGGAIVLGAVAAAVLLLLLLELVMLAKLYTSERNQLMRRWCAREEWRVVSRTKRENATYYR